MSNRIDPSFLTGKSKISFDLYRTPSYAVEKLLEVEKFDGVILEPCCGLGDISEVLKSNGYNTISNDKHADILGYGSKVDFLTLEYYADNIVSNPPFSLAEQFVTKALTLYHHKIAFLMRLSFLETSKRYNNIFKVNPPNVIYLFTKRIDYRIEARGTFGGGFPSAWYVWKKNEQCNDITLKFID